MNVYRQIFQNQFTEVAKRQGDKQVSGYDNEHGWTYLSDDCKKFKAIRTYKTLFAMKEDTTYYTPNTFYRNDRRDESSLRWLNALVIDIDVKNNPNNEGLTVPDILDRVEGAGLPTPGLIVNTPSGGFHVYFYFSVAKRAFAKTIEFYKRIQREVAMQIGGDLAAIGAERYFRIPTAENIAYESNNRVLFHDLIDWLIIQQEDRSFSKTVVIGQQNLLVHPAILRLLEGVEEGKRDNTCYTLALAFKASDYSEEAAETRLQEWNANLEQPLSIGEVKRKVRSAFQGSKQGPSAYHICLLSGMPFSYRPFIGKKDREDRQYSHVEEWEADILAYLEQQKGKISGSQRKLAEDMGVPFSSFKVVISRLQDSNRINLMVEGKGRGAKTTLELVAQEQPMELIQEENNRNIDSAPVEMDAPVLSLKKNEPNPYTLKDPVVGGSLLMSSISISPATYNTTLLGTLSDSQLSFVQRVSTVTSFPVDLVAYIYSFTLTEFPELSHSILFELLTTGSLHLYTRIDDLLLYLFYEIQNYYEDVG
ncbi:primase C-terminal domain-containing protein [Bacillus gaemokensis]|uniref:primase C-terminal domain-containing protein n=1 Tax=Bacillus gaemokensis TaxID=574375 RepID=UPI00068FEB79|nr:primase C-terminal domain-containing protein [Bacillus gaemokensis]KYG35601.1 hypothetical protein AZF08_26360 [Bacillus gaemokensis]